MIVGIVLDLAIGSTTWANDLTEVGATLVALFALLISLFSLSYARRSVRLAEAQDKRQRPKLVLGLIDCFCERQPDTSRVYSFHLSVANPSDSDNAILLIELSLEYEFRGEIMKVRVTSSDRSGAGRTYLDVPNRVPAHSAIAGWCDFALPAAALTGRSVKGYSVVITDTHQTTAAVEASVVRGTSDAD